MMPNINVLLCVLTLAHEGWSEYGDRIKNATVVWGENLQMEESRYSDYAVVPPPTELPVTFQAPFINAPNYWPNSPRRTVLDYQPYVPQDIITRPLTEGIHTFYGLMNQFFGVDESARRPPPPYQPPTRQQRPEYEYPYHPQNLRPFYLPGPKPLRASIQKLEPPRGNHISPQRNNYPQFVKILNDVLVENAYNNREPPVIEKPVYEYDNIIPTTYKPNKFKLRTSTTSATFPVSIQDQLPPVKTGQDTRIPYVTETTTIQTTRPTSVNKITFPVDTESIPPLDYSIDLRNSNVPIAKRLTPTTKPEVLNSTWAPPTTPVVDVTTDGESGIDKLNIVVDNTTENSMENVTVTVKEIGEKLEEQTKNNIIFFPTERVMTTTEPFTTAEPITQIPIQPDQILVHSMATELLDTMEPLYNDRSRSQFPKKLHSRKVTTDATNSADYVTDLTLQGLNDSKAIHVSVPKRFKPFNMSLVLDYVIGELNATAPPLNTRPFEDGLSLDAKILKDTNWDGYQPVIPTTEKFIETTTMWTTLPTTTDIPIKETTVSVKLETEDMTTTTITPPRSRRIRITTTSAVPVRKSLETTTVYPTDISITTSYPITTTEYVTIPFEKQTEVIATRVTQTVSKSLRQRQRIRSTTEEPAISPRGLDQENSSTEVTSTTRKGRKYQRKPKSQSFTQYSNKGTTQAPLKLGTISRPFYPKRSRPNATLTFNNIKINEDSAEKKLKKISSAEETTTRKNLYKRRKYPSHLRKTSTDESLVQDS